MELSTILKQLREKKGIGQKELATMLNYSTGTVSNYENGVHAPSLDTLSALADYYGVTTDYLLGRTDHPNDTGIKIMEQHISRSYTVNDLLRFLLCLPESERQIFMAFIMSIERLLSTPRQPEK